MTKLIIENIRLPITATEEDAKATAIQRLKRSGISVDGTQVFLHRKSLDARRATPTFVFSMVAETDDTLASLPDIPDLRRVGDGAVFSPIRGHETLPARPVIVGFGPAGIFAAIALAEAGLAPLVLEKGADVGERVKKVEALLSGGPFDPETNIQFGAGGAGTFSDGKLTTRIGDPLSHYVTEVLISLGAPEKIRYTAKPHIGTDVLREVVRRADERVRSLGGEIRYRSAVEHIGDGYVEVSGEKIPFGALVLACGHSAHGIYGELISKGINVEGKPFSVGVRIEHLQSDINRALYGKYADSPLLPVGEYNLSYTRGKRGVYTFCMCPGGAVVPSSAEADGIITNGMSYSDRGGRNANSAVAVTVNPDDYGRDPRRAIEFQRSIEKTAFRAAGGDLTAPAQSVGGFFEGKATLGTRILPSYQNGRVKAVDLNRVLPDFVAEALREGLHDFGKKLSGFSSPDAPLTGVETRTSSPVRIVRNRDTLTLCEDGRIYPTGEGAGYAGGIMSAAVDGLRVAGAILSRYGDVKN